MNAEATGNFDGKHLVIFGCGYIGGEVARQAVDRGLRVSALTRNAEKATGLRALGVTTVVGDLEASGWHHEVGPADFAVNCVSSGGGGADAYRRSYLGGMKSVLAWAAERQALQRLVYTSSTSVYSQDGGVRVDETSPATGRDERTAVLVETETLLRTSEATRGVVLRLAGIYGPGRTHLLKQVQAGEVSGVATHHLNLIHRDDVCGAIWAALGFGGEQTSRSVPITFPSQSTDPEVRSASHHETPAASAGRLFNVVDDGAATKGEITAWLAAQLGLPEPRFTGEPMGGRALVPDRIISNARLKAALGWSPRWPSYREGYSNLLSR